MAKHSAGPVTITDDYQKLATQSRGRELTGAEIELSKAMIEIFANGEHNFSVVVARLNEMKLARPSGEAGEWTTTTLESELRNLNESLDEAYLKNGLGG